MAPKKANVARTAVKKPAANGVARLTSKTATKTKVSVQVAAKADASDSRKQLSGHRVSSESWGERLGAGWARALEQTLAEPAFLQTLADVASERAAGTGPVYPPDADVFRAFAATPLDKVRVVVVGQDPYHGPGEAMGLSFSVPRGKKIPPSLRNMFKEIAANEGKEASAISAHGDLTAWSQQGVLLLNSVLTVREGQPNSHCKVGWQRFTDAALRAVSDHSDFTVFLLWGKFAADKAELIDAQKHAVLVSGHPSPLSFTRHFQGCDHFRKTNAILLENGRGPAIVWDALDE